MFELHGPDVEKGLLPDARASETAPDVLAEYDLGAGRIVLR
jgi:hypothetical protein